MARTYPDRWQHVPAEGALARELDTLNLLAEHLPQSCAIYHRVHWTRVADEHRLSGEVDFVVVGASGRVLLIEQKSGLLEETPEGLVAGFSRRRVNVSAGLAHAEEQLRARLQSFLGGTPVALDTLLYCPDHTVRQSGSAGIDPMRLVDATRRAHLPRIVQALIELGPDDDAGEDTPSPAAPSPAASAPAPAARELRERLHRFFSDLLRLVPEVNAVVGQAEALTTRLAGGLAEWARQLEMQPFRLRVSATAGSGKTQLAMAVLRDAVAAGRRPLYVCYNRPLADHIERIAPPGSHIATYHQLCDRMLRDAGQAPDFSRPGAFARMEQDAATLEPDQQWRFDELIVDEGQDFREPWRDHLLRLLRPEGRAWWLEDPMQNLYDRPEVPLPGWVRLRSERNYRSPSDVLDLLARVHALPQSIHAASPIADSAPEVALWHDRDTLLEATRRAITRAIGLGYKRDMIALVTYRGREHSQFATLDHLGPHRLRAFTGDYDLLGNPIHTTGDFPIDSVHRFKGQAAPCIIFTEIDFEALDTITTRKLFVGCTRANMKLLLVMTDRAARQLRLEPTPALALSASGTASSAA